jgi:hypothetical protein
MTLPRPFREPEPNPTPAARDTLEVRAFRSCFSSERFAKSGKTHWDYRAASNVKLVKEAGDPFHLIRVPEIQADAQFQALLTITWTSLRLTRGTLTGRLKSGEIVQTRAYNPASATAILTPRRPPRPVRDHFRPGGRRHGRGLLSGRQKWDRDVATNILPGQVQRLHGICRSTPS